jgi:DNA-binding response OmpR family regulator
MGREFTGARKAFGGSALKRARGRGASFRRRGPTSSVSPNDPQARLLLVEDDPHIRTFLADNLTADGFDVLVAEGVRDALRALEYKSPDLAVVDLGLPDGSGLEILRRVRESDGIVSRLDPAVPLLVLSGRAGELDRVRAFERGGDDFVAKPFSYAELRLRIRAVLRRTRARRSAGTLRIGELRVDPSSRDVRLRGEPIELSAKEFALLRALASDPTRVFTKVTAGSRRRAREGVACCRGTRSPGRVRRRSALASRRRRASAAGGVPPG